MEDRYVDTADGAFRRAGFAVRLRITGTGTIVSVKSRAKRDGAGGAMRREEIEGPADRALGPFEWPASDARSLVLELGGDAPLVEVVTVRQMRRRRQLRDRGTRVELSLDDVDVVVRGRVVARFVELEAELLQGNEELLDGLATSFDRDPALARSTSSKLETALAAIQGTSPAVPDRPVCRGRTGRGGRAGRARCRGGRGRSGRRSRRRCGAGAGSRGSGRRRASRGDAGRCTGRPRPGGRDRGGDRARRGHARRGRPARRSGRRGRHPRRRPGPGRGPGCRRGRGDRRGRDGGG